MQVRFLTACNGTLFSHGGSTVLWKKAKGITALADTELSEGKITARDGGFYVNVCARVLREYIFRSYDLP